MWNSAPDNPLPPTLLKGCIGGVLLGILLIISGGAYVVVSAFGIPNNLVLLVSIASGPVVGTLLLTLYAITRPPSQPPLDRARQRRPVYYDDEDS